MVWGFLEFEKDTHTRQKKIIAERAEKKITSANMFVRMSITRCPPLTQIEICTKGKSILFYTST